MHFIIHQAGYSVVRSLSEAPKYASVIATVLKRGQLKDGLANGRTYGNISMQGEPVLCLHLFQGVYFTLCIHLVSNFQCLLIYLLFQLGTLFGHKKGSARELFSSLGLH